MVKKPEKPVVILGGGLSGLTCARELSMKGVDVLVVEKEIRPGGLASWFEVEGDKIPLTYHHIMESDEPQIGRAHV